MKVDWPGVEPVGRDLDSLHHHATHTIQGHYIQFDFDVTHLLAQRYYDCVRFNISLVAVSSLHYGQSLNQ